MKALVINLAAEDVRMAFMAAQLECLGIGFERLEAVVPATVTPDPANPYWTRWERPLRTTEMAALASHRTAWEHVVAASVPMLILEDDAVLRPEVPDFLKRVEAAQDAELVTLETRGRRKLIAKTPHSIAPMHRLWQDRTGAAAYILRPSGARKLLDRVARAPGLADGILCAAYEVSAWQAVPALACQLDRCAAEGIPLPTKTDSAIDREVKPKVRPSASQKLRRIRAQMRMGIRNLTHRSGSDKVIVPLAKD